MRWLVPLLPQLLLPLLLSACADEPSPDETARANAAASQRVEEINQMAPPLEELAPDLITADDIEAAAMQGPGCRFMPGTNHGLRVIAREGDAFIKLNGTVERMAADSGSPALSDGVRTVYNGRAHTMLLAIAEGEEGTAEGAITLRDAWGRVTYAGTGAVECGTGL